MADQDDRDLLFTTVSMAEILLSQNLVAEARRVLNRLLASDPHNSRVAALTERILELEGKGEVAPIPVAPGGRDRVTLERVGEAVRLTWELTEEGLGIAERAARYSGRPVVRLFTAAPGPRGVRTATRDLDLQPLAAYTDLGGLPRPAVHVAAAGFLANTGSFVPLAESATLVDRA